MEISLQNKILKLFTENKVTIFQNDPSEIMKLREEAISEFERIGFPTKKIEGWRNTDLKKILSQKFSFHFTPVEEEIDFDKVFQCEVPDFDTHLISLYNGWFTSKDSSLVTLPNGTIVGSLARAFIKYPNLVLRHYNKYAKSETNGFNYLNTAYAQDGIFIYVPDNVESYKTIQMVNILDREDNNFVQNRNLVIVGKNSKLSLVHCDDSHNQKPSFTNTVTEIFLDENASVDHYKLQNLNNETTLINSTFFHQEANSNLSSFAITLNGGLVRNNAHIKLNGKGGDSNIYCLYLKYNFIKNYKICVKLMWKNNILVMNFILFFAFKGNVCFSKFIF